MRNKEHILCILWKLMKKNLGFSRMACDGVCDMLMEEGGRNLFL